MTKTLRVLVGLMVVALPCILGWYFSNPLVIPILGALYVPFYFFGKMNTWSAVGYRPTVSELLKAVPLTFVIQTVLVAVFYMIGRGLGTFFAAYAMVPALTERDATWIVGFGILAGTLAVITFFVEQRAKDPPAKDQAEPIAIDPADDLIMGDDGEFGVYTRYITPATFFRGQHFSRRDAVGIALKDIVDYKGEKPRHAPKAASAAMIAQAEDRLGLTLPDNLRKIYGVRDGGILPVYYVPRDQGGPQDHDNWITAFADDYNELKPLDQLEILQSEYDADYGTEEDKAFWIPGADKLVVIAARTGYGTALDYRKGPVPGVLLFDHGKPAGEAALMTFDSFDAFFAALREVAFDNVPRGTDERIAYGGPIDRDDPDAFWATGNPGAGVTQEEWNAAGLALGVTLPADLFPFYAIANGGKTKFTVALPEKDGVAPLQVFPSRYLGDGDVLVPVDQFVSLATLSDRIDFMDDRTPWRNLFGQPEKFIVIAGCYDQAILLDYTVGPEPAVRAVSDLENPDSAISFPSVDAFLGRLRRYGIEARDALNEIGDPKISTRCGDAATFWGQQDKREPVPAAIANAFIKKWGLKEHGLPQAINNIYAVQNGGAVRFRYTPPQFTNPHGYKNYDLTAKQWIDCFPDGFLAMEFWQPFVDWRKTHGLALAQSLFDFTDKVQAPYTGDMSDTKLNLFVIGDHTSSPERMVTVLDLSTAPFNRNRNLMTLRYDKATDQFETVFGPMMADNVYSGLFSSVRAYKSEL